MSTGDDETLPDTAMASGSDAGEPGEHLGGGSLRPDERRLLEDLERDVPGGTDRGEGGDDESVVEAAEDEAPLPAEGGSQDDGLDARFSDPG